MALKKDLKGMKFGRLAVIEESSERLDDQVTWTCKCVCGNIVNVKSVYLTTGQTKSCGCLKTEQDNQNLREEYENKRIDGVALPLFKGKKPRKDSRISYRGVSEYRTRVSKELRYRAWITVKGKRYYKSGFKTPEEAYYKGRLELERKHLPREEN